MPGHGTPKIPAQSKPPKIQVFGQLQHMCREPINFKSKGNDKRIILCHMRSFKRDPTCKRCRVTTLSGFWYAVSRHTDHRYLEHELPTCHHSHRAEKTALKEFCLNGKELSYVGPSVLNQNLHFINEALLARFGASQVCLTPFLQPAVDL